jgi:hypothetical protein
VGRPDSAVGRLGSAVGDFGGRSRTNGAGQLSLREFDTLCTVGNSGDSII